MERQAPSLGLRQRDRRLFLDMLRELREKKGLRQSDVGRSLGRKQGFVSKYETGERRLAFLDLVLVCDALDISMVDFVKRFDKARRGHLAIDGPVKEHQAQAAGSRVKYK